MQSSQQQFRTWHDQYRHRLLNGLTAVVNDREAAEEITAAALAMAWEKLDQFRGESSLYTWVYRIALNEARRQQSLRRPLSLDALDTPLHELVVTDGGSAGDNSQHERASDTARLRRALKQLPPCHRRILVDHIVHGRPVRYIARREAIPVGTVLSRLFRAKRLLRAAWEA